MFVVKMRILFLNVAGSGQGNSSIYNKSLPSMLEIMGWFMVFTGLPNNVTSAREIADFLVDLFRVGLAWHTISIYHSAKSIFLRTSSS